MNIENTLKIISLVVLLMVSLIGIFYSKTLYTNPRALPDKPPVWWAYDKKWWKKWARGAPVTPVAVLLAVTGVALGEYGNTSNTVVKTGAIALFFLALFVVLFNLFIVLTGRPKWIIPKHLR